MWAMPVFSKDSILAQTQKTVRYKTLQGTYLKNVYTYKLHLFAVLLKKVVTKLKNIINTLKIKRRLLYLKTQFLPHSKHFSSRL